MTAVREILSSVIVAIILAALFIGTAMGARMAQLHLG